MLCFFRQPPIVIAMQVIRFHPSALKSTNQTLTIDLYFRVRPYTSVLTILLLPTESAKERSDRNSDLFMDRCSGEKYKK